jgi:catechol 2,3-dioxygenase-like lactoylglutathione lyase family enzyme
MTDGIDYIYLETHDWPAAVRFWQALGFRVEMDLGRAGRLAHPAGGAAVFVEEVPADREPAVRVFLKAGAEVRPAAGIPPAGWHDSHWGTRLLELTDPDGRTVTVQRRPAGPR